ncbi:protein lap4, partial [Elysia marginata]
SLTKLHTLSISNNNLKMFPLALFFCTHLVTLDISSNLLEEISFEDNEITQSLMLTELYLSKNLIRKFPLHLQKAFPRLSKLDVSSPKGPIPLSSSSPSPTFAFKSPMMMQTSLLGILSLMACKSE